MPVYTYQCDCGFRFESSAPMSKATEPCKCPDCGKGARRYLPDNLDGVFQQQVSGPVPQNTGVAQLDAHIDRVIGQHARQSWSEIEKRVEAKKRVLTETGAAPEDLSRNPDGSYRVLAPEERGVHDRANIINARAMETLTAKKADQS